MRIKKFVPSKKDCLHAISHSDSTTTTRVCTVTLSGLRFLIHYGVAVSFSFAVSAAFQVAYAADACPGQGVAAQQGVVGFNSLIDGQPGTPLLPQLTVVPSYNFEEEKFVNQLSMSAVPASSGFWCQAQFEFFAPVVKAFDGEIDVEKSVAASWQQRWLIDDGSLPTLSTVVEVQVPYDDSNANTEISLIGIVAKSTGWGAVYLNSLAVSEDGSDFSSVDFSGVIGAKRIVNATLAVFADITIDEDGLYALELSAERDYSNGLSLGPGIRLLRSGDGSNGIDVSIGIMIFKVFGG
jgi:hypothetical protein